MRVRITSSQCTNLENDNGNWVVNDGTAEIAIGNKLYDFSPYLGYGYDIEGIGDFSLSQYLIQAQNIVVSYEEG